NKVGHFIADCPESSLKDKGKKSNFNRENFKNRIKKSLMTTWEDLDKLSDDDDNEEANLALMATASSDINSDLKSESDSDEDQE
ncbi:hypothetical protein A2U01_0063263, partial [Trifolium medium]|nr:hypothetical protein [Trifolium medium]